MEIATSCGLPVASVMWQSATGAWALTAVCKATFRLVPDVVTLTRSQEPPNDDDNYWNDDESRSLQAATDLVPFKPRADVLVVGHAFAPRRAKVRSLAARVCVGTVDKAVEVWCDRWFDPGGHVREGQPFAQMPLRWERAAGGPDTTNPVGIPFDAAPDGFGRTAIPNLQPAGAHLSYRGDRFVPAGFGPLAPHWPERTAKLHHRPPRSWHRRWNANPLPERFDPAYFNAAPLDQQTDPLRPDERIVLENLHADHPRLVTRLPGLVPQAVVQRATGHQAMMDLVADTLWIDTDRGLCTVVWRGRIGLTHPQEQGRIVFVCEGLTEQSFEAPPPPSVDPAKPGEVSVAAADEGDASMTIAPGLEAVARAVLPFETSRWVQSQFAKPIGNAAPAPPRPGGEDAGETIFLFPTNENGADATLPFMPTASAPEPPSPPTFEPPPAAAPSAPVQPQFALGTPAPAVAPPARSGFGAQDTQQAALVAVPETSPAPPPMLGPLARAEMATAYEAAAAAEEQASSPAVVADPLPVAPDAPAEAVKPDLEEYPIERCARIAARLACSPDPEHTEQALRAEELDAAGWKLVHDHWLGAMRARAERRDKALMTAYDRAYVSELEAQRGPITLEDYSRLAEAAERGAQEEALAARGLPGGAWASIHRVWIERMIKDASLAALVRRAMTERREQE